MLTEEMPKRSVINILTYYEKVKKDEILENSARHEKGEVSSDSLKWSSNEARQQKQKAKMQMQQVQWIF